MRYVGLAVGGVELVGRNGSCVNEWTEACALWDGVWGLKIVVAGKVSGYGFLLTETEGEEGERTFVEKSVLDVKADWVTKGLGRMKGLRWVEVWIEDGGCCGEERLRFKAELEGVLGGADVRVEGLGGMEEAGDGDEVGEEVGNLNPFAQIYPGLWGGS